MECIKVSVSDTHKIKCGSGSKYESSFIWIRIQIQRAKNDGTLRASRIYETSAPPIVWGLSRFSRNRKIAGKRLPATCFEIKSYVARVQITGCELFNLNHLDFFQLSLRCSLQEPVLFRLFYLLDPDPHPPCGFSSRRSPIMRIRNNDKKIGTGIRFRSVSLLSGSLA